jgi:hypothetical protein
VLKSHEAKRVFAHPKQLARDFHERRAGTAYPIARKIASAERRGDKDHASDLRPMMKDQQLVSSALLLCRHCGFVRRGFENLAPKLITVSVMSSRLMQPPML